MIGILGIICVAAGAAKALVETDRSAVVRRSVVFMMILGPACRTRRAAMTMFRTRPDERPVTHVTALTVVSLRPPNSLWRRGCLRRRDHCLAAAPAPC